MCMYINIDWCLCFLQTYSSNGFKYFKIKIKQIMET